MTILATAYKNSSKASGCEDGLGVNDFLRDHGMDYCYKAMSNDCPLVVRNAAKNGGWFFRLDQIDDERWIAVAITDPLSFYLIDAAEARAIMVLMARGKIHEGIEKLTNGAPWYNHQAIPELKFESNNINLLAPELREAIVAQWVALELLCSS